MKIIFFGSDDFALVNLEALVKSEHSVVACVTQPDKPRGRGMKMLTSPIKECAQKYKISVLQPERLKDPQLIEQLKFFLSDLFIVVAYGRILPIEVLSIPYLCCMNVHCSLLPKYRGAAPINWAILNGETETGVSIIKMNTSMDAGDIFSQTKMKIAPEDTSMTLRAKMAQAGSSLLLKTIDSLEKNAYSLAGQDHSKATLAPKLTKELGLIQWNKKAETIHNLVRGLLPWPTAYTHCQGKLLKILQTQILPAKTNHKQPGEVVAIQPEGFVVATQDQELLIRQVHPESAKAMDAKSFIAGHKLKVGDRLGS